MYNLEYYNTIKNNKSMFLITGCSGFIGYHITKNFLESGHKVIGIDNLNSYYSVDLKKDRLKELKKFNLFNFYKLDLSKIIN